MHKGRIFLCENWFECNTVGDSKHIFKSPEIVSDNKVFTVFSTFAQPCIANAYFLRSLVSKLCQKSTQRNIYVFFLDLPLLQQPFYLI